MSWGRGVELGAVGVEGLIAIGEFDSPVWRCQTYVTPAWPPQTGTRLDQ